MRYVGDPVACVIAETVFAAKDAAEAVEVDIDPLAAVIGLEDAAREGAPLLYDDVPGNVPLDYHFGNTAAVDAAFASAAHVTRLKLLNSRLVVNAMEPRAALAAYDGSRFTMYVAIARRDRHARANCRLPRRRPQGGSRPHRTSRRLVRHEGRAVSGICLHPAWRPHRWGGR